MSGKTAFIFPAFVHKYTGKETQILTRNKDQLSVFLSEASKILGIDFLGFDIIENNYMHDEQKNQFISYILSCAFSDLTKKHLPKPDYVSGFSMGIYAAFYHTNILSFENGLLLIRDIYQQIQSILDKRKFAMISVVGFDRTELEKILKSYSNFEIVIQNGTHSFVLAGNKTEVENLIELLKQEGAIHINQFEVNCPYHSAHLSKERNSFVNLLSGYNFSEPEVPVLSMVDNKIINNPQDAREEIIRNVSSPLNFYSSIQHFQTLGVSNFIEIGPGDSLLKSSKFIEGEFTFNAISKGKLM